MPAPSEAGRADIFRVLLRGVACGSDIDVHTLAASTDGWSGAQIQNACREAGMCALRESLDSSAVCLRHLQLAIEKLNAARLQFDVGRTHTAATAYAATNA